MSNCQNCKTSCYNLKIRNCQQNCVMLFYYFVFGRNYEALKSKSSCILLNKTKMVSKMDKMVSKMENPSFTETTLCFSSYKNRKLKSNCDELELVKKEAIFVPFVLSEGNSSNICVLSQCIVYLIHFQNIHTFT